MKKWILIMLPLLLLVLEKADAQQRLKKVKITEGIKAKLPEDFRPLTEDEIASRYYMRNRPVAIYSNEERTIDFGVNFNSSAWRAEDLDMLQGFYRSSILNLYDEVEMLEEGIKTIDKQRYITFEYRSVVKGDPNSVKYRVPVQKYHYIMYTIKQNKVVIFNFTCPARLQPKWQDTAHEIMESVKLKKLEVEEPVEKQ